MPSYMKVALAAAGMAALLSAKAGAITVDGTLDTGAGGYGSALSTQTINTGFGDSTSGDGTSANGSEMDAAYGTIQNGNLYLFLSGNTESNGNRWNVFIADGRTGQNVLALPTSTGNMGSMNGSIFSPGFMATEALDLNDYNGTAYVEEYSMVGGTGTGGYQGSFGLTGGIGTGSPDSNAPSNPDPFTGNVTYGFNNTNAAGVNGNSGTAASASDADAVTTGLEIGIPLSLLGNPTGNIEVLADINGSGDGYLSNQFLPGLAVGTGNVGGGGPYSGPSSAAFDFATTPGEYFTVAVPEPASMALLSVFGLAAARRRRV